MSILAPLYFLGAMAVGLPILFHLIRRQPRGQVQFSSLMFLQPTPPRLTRRSRLDNFLLLLLRALALILLAAAFARPFLRSALMSDANAPARRMVMVIDTSASMQRTGLWQQALDRAADVIEDLSAGDQLAIISFDRKPTVLFSFDQSSRLPPEQFQAAAKSALADAAPTWYATDLGRAISLAADLAVTHEPRETTDDGTTPNESKTLSGPAHLILISDMQEGARIESLQTYAWPDQLYLDIRAVKPASDSNAFARVLTARDDTSDEDEQQRNRIRVRVENTSESDVSRFRLAWSTDDNQESAEIPVQIPPGESRVVRMPLPDPNVTSLVLQDDAHSFDNRRYLVSPQPEALTLLYLGDPPPSDDVDRRRDNLMHYLQQVPLNNVRREVTVQALQPGKLVTPPDPDQTPLIVVTQAIELNVADQLKSYIENGGQVLVALATPEAKSLAPAVQRITGAELQIDEAQIDDYAMLSRIDFGHPMFRLMADPKFNDFTKIHFWSHRTITGVPDDWGVLASFDNEHPALLEHASSGGKLWILATGWQPNASELALSSKFIPLVYSFFDASSLLPQAASDYVVGGKFDFKPAASALIAGPDGRQFPYQRVADSDSIDQPGVFHFSDNGKTRPFAVNLAIAESRTDALPEDSLERFGISLGKTLSIAQMEANQRQLRDIELESRQKLWQWLIVAAMVFLGLETWLGGRLSRREIKET